MRVHRRQFVLGPAPVLVDESWRVLEVGRGLLLSYQEALPVGVVRSRDGSVWYLLGLALQSDPARPAPLEELASAAGDEVDALTATWCGRWGLLGRGTLRGDACLFGCCYARDPRSGALLVSSSPALLHGLLREETVSPPLEYRVGMDWYPPPATRFGRVRRLLPSQLLALDDAGDPVRQRPLLRPVLPPDANYEERLEFLERSFRTILRRASELGPPVVLALTGGQDSRVLLAAAAREGLDVEAFTWRIPGMSRADSVLPPLLARDVGIPHRFVPRRHFDEQRLRLLDEHSALHTVDRDRELIPWGQYDQLPEQAIIVLGSAFALAGQYYYTSLPARPESIAEAIAHKYDFLANHPQSAAHREGIREWAAWVEAHPEPGLDWRDRFYWEQFEGGWCAAQEQGTELVDVTCLTPVNAAAVITAMLGIEPDKRYGRRWQVDLTYRMAPALADHPYNLGGPLETRLRWAASAWRHHPSKSRFLPGRARALAARARASRPAS